MSQTYEPIPDLTFGQRKGDRENDLFDWLRSHCEWREGTWSATAPVFEAYAAWEKGKHGISVADRSIAQSLFALGYRVESGKVLSVFLRGKEATVPVAAKQSGEGLRVAAPSADLIEANLGPIKPEPEPEVRFIEHGPMPTKKKD